jgi:hypothetical protein
VYAEILSGVSCDGCGEGNLLPDPGGKGEEPVACDLCGLKADLRKQSRKWMDDDGIPWTKRERKKAETLFFLWVTLDPERGDAVFDVMKVLGLDGMSSGGGADSLIELDTKPTDDQVRRLAAVDGVTKVWLAP